MNTTAWKILYWILKVSAAVVPLALCTIGWYYIVTNLKSMTEGDKAGSAFSLSIVTLISLYWFHYSMVEFWEIIKRNAGY